MPRRLTLLAAVFAVLLAGCAPDLASFGPDGAGDTGPRFVTHAVDVKENSGVGLGLATDDQGTPNISYLRLDEQERIPSAPQPADPQTLPAVMVASFTEGIWTRTIVAQEAPVQPEGSTEPDAPRKFADLSTSDSTDVAVDGAGNRHVAWTNGGEAIQYASEAGGGFANLPDDPVETVAEGDVSRVSIAAGGDGVPAIAFYDGDTVKVATKTGDAWSVETVAESVRPEDGARTDIAASSDGPVVAFGDGGDTVVATRGEDGAWAPEATHDGGGLGVSISSDGSTVAYVTEDGDVKVDGDTVAEGAGPLTTPAPSPTVEPSPGVDVPQAPALPPPSAGVTLDGDGNVWVAWGDAEGVKYARGDEDFEEVHAIPAGLGGANPHLAPGADGPVAAWYQFDSSSVSAALFTEGEVEFAVASPEAPLGGGGRADCSAEGTELEITAPPGAAASGFDTECLAAPAGDAFSVHFLNEDDGVPHNWTAYTDQSVQEVLGGAGDATSTITGPDETTYDVDALEAGEYFFQCDLHPSMTGTLVIEAAGEGGEGGEGGGETPSPEPSPDEGTESPAPSPTS